MHGHHIARNLLRALGPPPGSPLAENPGLVRITVSEMLGLSAEELEHGLSEEALGTPWAGLAWQVEVLPLQAWCGQCKRRVGPIEQTQSCPHCGGDHLSAWGAGDWGGVAIELFCDPLEQAA